MKTWSIFFVLMAHVTAAAGDTSVIEPVQPCTNVSSSDQDETSTETEQTPIVLEPGQAIALVLSGGGPVRGAAHLGVLEHLESLGVEITHIFGTSIGALVGGLYSEGASTEEIEDFLRDQVPWNDLIPGRPERSDRSLRRKLDDRFAFSVFELGLPWEPIFRSKDLLPSGLAVRHRLVKALRQELLRLWERKHLKTSHPSAHREKILFWAVATNLETGRSTALQRDDIGDSVLASMSVPVMFPQMTLYSEERGIVEYIDGGISDNLPFTLAHCILSRGIGTTTTFDECISREDSTEQESEYQEHQRPRIIAVDVTAGYEPTKNVFDLSFLSSVTHRNVDQQIREIRQDEHGAIYIPTGLGSLGSLSNRTFEKRDVDKARNRGYCAARSLLSSPSSTRSATADSPTHHDDRGQPEPTNHSRAAEASHGEIDIAEATFGLTTLQDTHNALAPTDSKALDAPESEVETEEDDQASEKRLARFSRARFGHEADRVGLRDAHTFEQLRSAISQVTTSMYRLDEFEHIDVTLQPAQSGGDAIDLRFLAQPRNRRPDSARVGLSLSESGADEGLDEIGLQVQIVRRRSTPLGGEIQGTFSLASRPTAEVELFQPLGQFSKWFLSLSGTYQEKRISAIRSDRNGSRPTLRTVRGALDLGVQFANIGEVRFGAFVGKQRTRFPDETGSTESSTFGGLRLLARYDTLDSYFFPSSGSRAELAISESIPGLGSDHEYRKLSAEGIWVPRLDRRGPPTTRWSTLFRVRLGLNQEGLPTWDQFTLGGLFDLSGSAEEAYLGQSVFLVQAAVYRQFKQLKDLIGRGIYLGLSLEAGNSWQDRFEPRLGDLSLGGAVFLGAETVIAPVYIGYGYNELDGGAYYFRIGAAW